MSQLNYKVSLSFKEFDSQTGEEINFKYRLGGQRKEVYIKDGYLKSAGIKGNPTPDELASLIADRVLDEASKQPFGTLDLLEKFNALTPELKDQIMTERDRVYEELLRAEFDRAFDYRDIGRKKDSLNAVTPKFESKTDFFTQLKDFVADYSISGDLPTQKQAAEKLGFSNGKALHRKIRNYGVTDRWQNFCQKILKEREN